jgi:hypothetical protein
MTKEIIKHTDKYEISIKNDNELFITNKYGQFRTLYLDDLWLNEFDKGRAIKLVEEMLDLP